MHCKISKTWLYIALFILRLRLLTQNSSFLLLGIKKSMSDILWFSMRWLIQFALMWSQLYWVLELICRILCHLEIFRLSLLCDSVGMIDRPVSPRWKTWMQYWVRWKKSFWTLICSVLRWQHSKIHPSTWLCSNSVCERHHILLKETAESL